MKDNKNFKSIKWIDLFVMFSTILLFSILIGLQQWYSILSFTPIIPLVIWCNINNWFFISNKNTENTNFYFQLKNIAIKKYTLIISIIAFLIPSLFAILFNNRTVIFFFQEWYYEFGNLLPFIIINLLTFAIITILNITTMIITTKIFNKKDIIKINELNSNLIEQDTKNKKIALSEIQLENLRKTKKILFWYTISYYAIYLLIIVILIIKVIKKKK